MKLCSSRFLVLIWDEACWRPRWPSCCSHATQADRSEGELRLPWKTTTGQILSNLPVQTKKKKRWYPWTGNWLNLFTSKLENMSVPYRGKKKVFLWKLVNTPCYFSIIDIYNIHTHMNTCVPHTYTYTHGNTHHTHKLLYIFSAHQSKFPTWIHLCVTVYVFMCKYTRTYMHACIHTCIHTFILYVCMCKYVHAYLHTCIHTHVHTNILTHTHTHTHIYIYIYMNTTSIHT
jgi:hypothetical protein